jgi:hypothetical protein
MLKHVRAEHSRETHVLRNGVGDETAARTPIAMPNLVEENGPRG